MLHKSYVSEGVGCASAEYSKGFLVWQCCLQQLACDARLKADWSVLIAAPTLMDAE